jgi:hypothetical protein
MVMKRLFAALLFLCSSLLFSAPKDTDYLVQALIQKYGGLQIKNDHVVASGVITYADKTNKSFTLTAKKRILRMELQSADEAMTIVRRDGRSQITKNQSVDYPKRTPRSGSAINLLPIYALLEYSDDLRFTGTTVQETDGSSSIKFVEGTPPGVKPPPFPQPKQAVAFSLDSSGRIAKIEYFEEEKSSKVVSYRYFYDSTVAGSFLQPGQIICFNGEKQAWVAAITATQKKADVSSYFFKIRDTRELTNERMKNRE